MPRGEAVPEIMGPLGHRPSVMIICVLAITYSVLW
jgi:hypothetical protein